MAKNMYQKREERKNKKLNGEEKKFQRSESTGILGQLFNKAK